MNLAEGAYALVVSERNFSLAPPFRISGGFFEDGENKVVTVNFGPGISTSNADVTCTNTLGTVSGVSEAEIAVCCFQVAD